MRKAAFHILRVGIAITFLWIGVFIFQNPEGWGEYLQLGAAKLLVVEVRSAMIVTAVFDILVGFLLLTNYLTFWAASLAALHLIIVIGESGINPITVRDIGLLAGALSLAFSTYFKYGFSKT